MANTKKIQLWHDPKGNLGLWQTPNKWAWIAIVSWLWARTFQDSGLLDFLGLIVFYPAAGYWAYLEITDGTNLFRRLLGTMVAVVLLFSLAKRLL